MILLKKKNQLSTPKTALAYLPERASGQEGGGENAATLGMTIIVVANEYTSTFLYIYIYIFMSTCVRIRTITYFNPSDVSNVATYTCIREIFRCAEELRT